MREAAPPPCYRGLGRSYLPGLTAWGWPGIADRGWALLEAGLASQIEALALGA